MSVQNSLPDLEKLEVQVDNLEDALAPMLKNLPEMSSQLPLLDRAKLYSTINYAIGTLVFSTQKLHTSTALEHPVYTTELKRVQQYFQKIEAAENPAKARNATVDTEAATRMIKAGLSDDVALKNRLADQVAKEQAKAFMKKLGKRSAPDSKPASTPTENAKPPKKQKLSKSEKKARQKIDGNA